MWRYYYVQSYIKKIVLGDYSYFFSEIFSACKKYFFLYYFINNSIVHLTYNYWYFINYENENHELKETVNDNTDISL